MIRPTFHKLYGEGNLLLYKFFRFNHRNRIQSTMKCYLSNLLHNDSPKLGAKGNHPSDILALDFDGVICASSHESSYSSIIAVNDKWFSKSSKPEIPVFTNTINLKKMSSEFLLIQSIVNELRPIIETGYENMLLVRFLWEEYQYSVINNSISNDKYTNWSKDIVSKVYSIWNHEFRDSLLNKYNTSKQELITFFGNNRDLMIKDDLNHWVSLNPLYPIVSDTLFSISKKYQESNEFYKLYNNLYIVTTKQERFVKAILESNNIYLLNSNGLSNNKKFENDISIVNYSNIFHLDNIYGSKINVLIELNHRMKLLKYNKTIHFVEDRYETLVNTIKFNEKNGNLSNVKLYLADWGYNTQEQREEAKLKYKGQITVIDQAFFQNLLTSLV